MVNYVVEFENKIAEFYNAPYAVAVDCCTHGLEIAIRLNNPDYLSCTKYTYISVPMTFIKLGIAWSFNEDLWSDYYYITPNIIDAAVLWRKNSYIPNTFMVISFQHKKHLKLGRGGMILCSTKEQYNQLKALSYDGRHPGPPWMEQDIYNIGYHYYLTPEIASLGLEKLEEAISRQAKKWSWQDYPNISKMKVFNDYL